CSQCGMVDFYNNSFFLNGRYEFEKRNVVKPGLYVDIIRSEGNYTGKLDTTAQNITYLYPGAGMAYSGVFGINFYEGERGFVFTDKRPYRVDMVDDNIVIEDNKLFQENPDNMFIMYENPMEFFKVWYG
ncbi:MAG: hypothetical protein ACQESF_06435, partial [Nanobdellota archaeon]